MGLFKRKGKLSFNARKRKYAREIRTKVETKKNGQPYTNKNGEIFPLSNTQLSFRSGYFTAIKDMFRFRKQNSKIKNKKKTFSVKDLSTGKTKHGLKVCDGIYIRVGKNKFKKVKELTNGSNYVRQNGKFYKVKGKNDISSSIDYFFN